MKWLENSLRWNFRYKQTFDYELISPFMNVSKYCMLLQHGYN